MPAVFVLLMIASAFSGRSMLRGAVGGSVAIVDSAGIVDVAFAAELAAARAPGAAESPDTIPLTRYDALEPALEALRAGNVSAVYELAPDYVATGRVTGYALQRGGSFGQALIGRRQGAVSDAIRAKPAADAGGCQRPGARLRADGSIRDSLGHRGRQRYRPRLEVRPQHVSRVSRYRPAADDRDLLLGRVSAAGDDRRPAEPRHRGAALVRRRPISSFWGRSSGWEARDFSSLPSTSSSSSSLARRSPAVFTVPLVPFLLSLVYFVIGYLLYAALMGGTGMLGRTPQEGAQLSRALDVHCGEPAVRSSHARGLAR